MLATWLTLRYFNGAQGSGIPQAIAARRLAAAGTPVGHLLYYVASRPGTGRW